MNRIKEVELAGKKYPLNFSTFAVKKVIGKYGSLQGMEKAFANGEKDPGNVLEEFCWILSVLIDQGCKYEKVVNGQEITPLSQEEIEIIIGPFDLEGIMQLVLEAIAAGQKREVEVNPSKNGKATQGK